MPYSLQQLEGRDTALNNGREFFTGFPPVSSVNGNFPEVPLARKARSKNGLHERVL
jgi:hypothetical protein